MGDRGARRRTAVVVTTVLLAAALTACDALGAAGGDTDGDGDTAPRSAAAGGPDDWARLVCGEDAPVEETDGAAVCHVEDGGYDHRVEARVEGADPVDDLQRLRDTNQSDATSTAWAVTAADGGWGVVVVTALDQIDAALLQPLAEDGFEVDA